MWLQMSSNNLSVDQGGIVGLSIAKTGNIHSFTKVGLYKIPNVIQFPAMKIKMKKSNDPSWVISIHNALNLK